MVLCFSHWISPREGGLASEIGSGNGRLRENCEFQDRPVGRRDRALVGAPSGLQIAPILLPFRRGALSKLAGRRTREGWEKAALKAARKGGAGFLRFAQGGTSPRRKEGREEGDPSPPATELRRSHLQRVQSHAASRRRVGRGSVRKSGWRRSWNTFGRRNQAASSAPKGTAALFPSGCVLVTAGWARRRLASRNNCSHRHSPGRSNTRSGSGSDAENIQSYCLG